MQHLGRVVGFAAEVAILAVLGFVNYKWLLVYPQEAKHRIAIKWLWTFIPFAYIATVSAAALFIPPVPNDPARDPDLVIRTVFAATLALGPPLYFFTESVWLYGKGHGGDADYKATQDLASKVWIAISAVLGLYWFHKP